ncbi:MAG TPA: fluoride efflux transporter CrcB [Gammaproteobacteria bacterium]|nr:fluoride efflux transporter CrcB [Gammaproteobacteria bacterium]
MREFLLISLGAVVGANLRYWVGNLSARYLSASLPWGTLIINVTGSFILGFFLVWTTDRVMADPRWRPLVAVGFCGAYTTFSSYSYETFSLMEQGHYSLATGNFAANNLLALAGVVAGAVLARSL